MDTKSLVGKKFANFTVIEYIESIGSNSFWRCECVCGSIQVITRKDIKRFAEYRSCGCVDRPSKPIKDVSGNVFGRLTVLNFSHRKDKNYYYNCKCKCGNSKTVSKGSLTSGRSTSCGCYAVEMAKEKFTKHGDNRKGYKATEYSSWQSMITRCTNPNWKRYNDWGGRGITVCSRWIGADGYKNFLEDMGRKPSPQHSLDRKENDKGYYKDNCRWSLPIEQNNNQRTNRKITIDGMTMNLSQWSTLVGVGRSTISRRIKAGWDEKTAVYTPVKQSV